MAYWLTQTFNGLTFGMLLFLLAAGLSLIFGLMRIVNLAHGSFYLLGAYLALTVSQLTGSFLLAVLGAAAVVACLGIVIERLFLRRVQNQELPQVLLTFGFIFVLEDIALWLWGAIPTLLEKPVLFAGSLQIGGIVVPSYRILIVVVGLLIAAALWALQSRTRIGAIIRASVDDEEMARGLGINTPRMFTWMFALGCFLAALGGVMGGALVGMYPGAGFEILVLALVVVIVGGLGSLRGAFIGSLLVGLLDNFGKALFPELSLFTIFAPMAIVLAVKPTGLFGRA
ncbi:MAG: branched-chain amino acid ABC transporter permease [Candidatus Tectomicrobia bacterium]|nr:branched-chain amino acid ABC transporter permease [Candidatus Tectomicrobia bacterium]